MATNQKVIELSNRVKSIKSSDDPAVDHIVAGADDIYDDEKGKKQSEVNQDVDAALENRYTKEETYNKTELNNLITTPNVNYVTVGSYASLPATGAADTIYRVSNYDGAQSQVDATKYSEYAWNGSAYVLLCVKSQVGEVFDISDYHSGAVYADLSEALGVNGANVPTTIRRGGMSVKFRQITTLAEYSVDKTEGLDEQPIGTELLSDPDIDDGTYNASQLSAFATLPTSTGVGNAVTYWMAVAGDSTTYTKWVVTLVHTDDNKYVNYRLTKDEWSIDTNDWAIAEEGVYVENPEFIKVYADKDDKILWAIKTDGTIYFGAGVPLQVVDYIQQKIAELSLDEYEDIVAFLNGLKEGDKTLQELLNEKLDAEGLESEALSALHYVESPEFVGAWVDSQNRILFGVKDNADFYFGYGVPNQIVDYVTEYINTNVFVGDNTNIINSINKIVVFLNGFTTSETLKQYLNTTYGEYIEDIEDRIEVKTDSNKRILSYRNTNGVLHENVGIEAKSVDAENSNFGNSTIKHAEILAGSATLENLTLTESGIEKFKEDLVDSGFDINDIKSYVDAVKVMANMPSPHPINESGKEMYSELSVYNVERKACRCRYIRWTALSSIPRNAAAPGNFFPAGNMIGIPYSSAMENDKIVGYDISFVTFMTAANNPFSMLYTENLRDNGSVYGFTYSQPARGTVACWAGIVCNILTDYSTGAKIPYDTGMFAYLASIGFLTKVYNQTAQGVRIGDFLWESGHARLVQNVWRGDNGLVEKIEVSKGGWFDPEYMFNSPEAFNVDLLNRNGIIYRNAHLYENDKYEDIPFSIIPVSGAAYPADAYSYIPAEPYNYNDDICTFAGDYACFREGFRIVLNYNLKDDKAWESVELYKNEELYGTYLLSSDVGTYDRGPGNFPAETAALVASHSFDLSFLNLTYGKYKARLTDGNGNYSDYTYFEVLDTVVTHSISNNIIHVAFSSHNGRPSYVRLSRSNGSPKCIYALTKEDIAKGYCEFDYINLVKQQYNNLSTGDTVVKVYFEGDYGDVTNAPQAL